jgi:DNA polymerase elongation subunit (family B)
VRALTNIQASGKNFHIWYYDEQGKKQYRLITDFQPYFYGSHEDHGIICKESEVEKIVVNHPAEVREKRKEYAYTFCADVLYANRYLIDTYSANPIPKAPLRVGYFDIENLYDEKTKAMPSSKKADFPITAISVLDSRTAKIFTFSWHETIQKTDNENGIFVYGSERELLLHFLEFMKTKKFDVICGWNSEDYDLPYIVNRLKQFGLETALSPINEIYFDEREERWHIAGLSHIDYMLHCKKRNQREKESWSLDFVANEILGEQKIKPKKNLNQLWKENLDEFLEYNRWDAELVYRIETEPEKGLRFLDMADEIRRLGRVTFDDTLKNSRIFDNAIIARLKEEGKVIWTKPKKEEGKYVKFKGAYVKEPKQGIYDWVADLDGERLYPSIIIGRNISPERLEKGEQGIIPKILLDFIEMRKRYKKEYLETREESARTRQVACKFLVNSIYGYLGYRGARLFNKELAEEVTKTAQKIVKTAIETIEGLGYEVIASDTDSTFFCTKANNLEEAKECVNKVQLAVDKRIALLEKEIGMDTGHISFKLESISKEAMFFNKKTGEGAKKRYVLHIVEEEGNKQVDRIDYTGGETIRADTPKFAKDILKQIYETALRTRDKEKVEGMIREYRKKIKELKPEQIALPISIKENPSNFIGKKHVPIHVSGAIFWNKYFNPKIVGRTKVKYLYILPSAKYGSSHVISLPQGEKLPEGISVDYAHMEQRLVDMKLSSLMDIFGIKEKNNSGFW